MYPSALPHRPAPNPPVPFATGMPVAPFQLFTPPAPNDPAAVVVLTSRPQFPVPVEALGAVNVAEIPNLPRCEHFQHQLSAFNANGVVTTAHHVASPRFRSSWLTSSWQNSLKVRSASDGGRANISEEPMLREW
ncbi:hypothetical protein Aduo_006690 [Ancylostoma duodenale]